MDYTVKLGNRSNLILPTSYIELDLEEMTYIDGGKITYYYGWDAINACFAAALGVSVFKLGTTALGTIVNTLKSGGVGLLRSLNVSSLSSLISSVAGSLNVLFWIRLASYGIAIVSGLISIASSGNCKIGLLSVFGFNLSGFYAGVN